MSTDALGALPVPALRALAAALRDGPLAAGLSQRALQQVAGPHASALGQALGAWLAQGMTPAHVAMLVDAVADTRAAAPDPMSLMDLVLSGPDLPGLPTGDTAATMHAMIAAAEHEVLLVGYAVHNGRQVFAPLADRMAAHPSLRVMFCLDISRDWADTTLASLLVSRFAHEFLADHWPWPTLPDLYYDPRSLDESRERRSCLHAKCVVVDRRVALVTSANFTAAAQERNIEVGVLLRQEQLAGRLHDYFHGLIAHGLLRRCPLGDA